MPLKHLVLGLAIVATIPTAFTTAEAADGLYVPLLTYRTGPFAGSGIPYANGLTDYLNMLNQRDGGIGGIKLIIEECETGYDTILNSSTAGGVRMAGQTGRKASRF